MNINNLENKKCTGCGYCVNICPVNAISFQEDDCGYYYPKASNECIDCGKCINDCPNQRGRLKVNIPKSTYAAVRNDKKKLLNSSSGGIFAAISERVLENDENWYVAGCILDDNQNPIMIVSNDPVQVKEMYGSKYVQASMVDLYKEINVLLEDGKKVLFSGTPCQINAIKKFTKCNPNLYTIEVICHGVPNEKMFKSYLKILGNDKIQVFIFRDKKQGWSFNNRVIYENGKKLHINHRLSSYMTYFLNGETYRESCYNCIYAQEQRGADITIGDFWGIIKKRPDLQKSIDISKGVSCLLVNSTRGFELVKNTDIELFPVKYEDIKEGNEPLNHPTIVGKNREEILNIWRRKLEWKDVDILWKKKDFSIVFLLWSMVPNNLKHIVRIILHKR